MRECHSPKKEEKDSDGAPKAKPETKPVGSANAVATSDKGFDGCWAAELAIEEPKLDAPALIDESDWLCEEGETAAAVITPSNGQHERVKLYDSGATCRILPYQSDFSTYVKLDPPIFLNAANQQRFPTIGTGTLIIHAPNRGTQSSITLHDVLHAPAVGYTLVLLGALDQIGRASCRERVFNWV